VVSGRDLVTANALTPTAGTIMAAVGAVVGVWLRSAVGGGDAGSQVVLVAAIVGYLLAALIATRIGVNALGPRGATAADHGGSGTGLRGRPAESCVGPRWPVERPPRWPPIASPSAS
jgi:hypothetical protein